MRRRLAKPLVPVSRIRSCVLSRRCHATSPVPSLAEPPPRSDFRCRCPRFPDPEIRHVRLLGPHQLHLHGAFDGTDRAISTISTIDNGCGYLFAARVTAQTDHSPGPRLSMGAEAGPSTSAHVTLAFAVMNAPSVALPGSQGCVLTSALGCCLQRHATSSHRAYAVPPR